MTSSLEVAWEAVHDALPARWHVGPVTYDPGRHDWSVTARDGTRGRGKIPKSVTGFGVDDVAALCDLGDRLQSVPHPDGSRQEELRRRVRLAYLVSGGIAFTGRGGRAPLASPMYDNALPGGPIPWGYLLIGVAFVVLVVVGAIWFRRIIQIEPETHNFRAIQPPRRNLALWAGIGLLAIAVLLVRVIGG